jgi:site-specific DNA-methyltransferase (adenine-specific)
MEINFLYNEDCLEFMKKIDDNSIQFIIADPPYLISDKTDTFHLGEGNFSKYTLIQGEWDLVNYEIIYDCIKEFKRILKRGGSLIIWYDMWKITPLKKALEDVKLKQIRLCIWSKKNSPPISSNNSYLPNSKEVFLYSAKNTSYLKKWFKAPFNSKYDNGIYNYSISGKNRIHPTEKPYKLMEDIILKHTNIGDLVYIPFAGSGVDIEVCIRNNRNWLATEIDNNYCLNIEKRLSSIKK